MGKFQVLLINMTGEKVSQKLKLKKIDETRNQYIEEIKKKIDLMSKMYKMFGEVWITLH